MALNINTNIASLNAQRNLGTSQSSLTTSLQRLSSGLRINSAKDDAAGLAIADRMTSQVRGFQTAARNANDAISLSQTAEGAMSEIGNNLQRMRELALQSANGSNSSSDRASLNAEVTQLMSEIGRVSSATQFNGLNLLDGTFQSTQFQVGANANQTIGLSISGTSTDILGSYGGTSAAVTATGFTAGNSLVVNNVTVGPSVDRSASAAGWSVGSAASKAAAINVITGSTGVTATATTSVVGTSPIAGSAMASGDMIINGVAIGAVAAQSNAPAQGQAVSAAINAKTASTGVSASYDGSTGAVSLTSAEGRDIALTTGSAAAATRIANATGLSATTGGTAATAGTSTMTFAGTVVTGQTATLNGVVFTFDGAVASGTNTVVDATHVTVGSTGVLATAATMATNLGAAITTAKASSLTSSALQSITPGVAAGVVTLTDARSGLAATVGRTLTTNATGGTAVAQATGADYTVGALSATTGGTITLNSSSSVTVTGTGTGLASAGLSTLTLGLTKLSTASIDTVANANSAISIIDAALAQVNSQRASLGSAQNRFTSTIASLQTSFENLSAARGRIQDTDFAAETANLTKSQILGQAGTAMLAQANALPQSVLSLLQG